MASTTTNVLVTGANGGLGLGICLRLIDDFLSTQRTTESLNIIYTTRTARKGSDTLKTLQSHLHRHHATSNRGRVTFQAENVELTHIPSILALAHKLLSSDLLQIDVIVCNAGIGGWTGLDWFTAIPDLLTDMRSNTTWPRYKLGTVGAVTKLQLPETPDWEPPLGEVFCANLFGHYMLVHWLMPLLRACDESSPAKIIWVSSIEPQVYHFSQADLQGLTTDAPYESSKRVTDILALTADHAHTASSLATFNSVASSLTRNAAPQSKRKIASTPIHHLYHPGIVVTSVISLYWIVAQAYLLGIYLARWLGSPWATVEPYTAAHGATFLVVTGHKQIREAEAAVCAVDSAQQQQQQPVVTNGRIKWGTAVNCAGVTTVRPTEVDKWGISGSGLPYAKQWWGGKLGRKPGAVEANQEDVKQFVASGAKVWEEMETLRREWEQRLEKAKQSTTVQN